MKATHLPAAPNANNPPAWQVVLICVSLVLAILAVFAQTLRFQFINYDDGIYVFDNTAVKAGLTWKGVLWALSYTQSDYWHPLTWLSHMADCQIFGLWAGGHHLTNLALHTVSTLLLFLVLRGMTGALWRSAFVAMLFAIHPLRVESVAWIAERKDVLSGMFFMLTLRAYGRYVRLPSRGRYVSVVVLYGLGLLSKNMIVTLPFVLLLLDWWPLGRMKLAEANGKEADSPRPNGSFYGLVKEKIPLFLLSVASCVTTACTPEKLPDMDRLSILERVGNALVSYMIYLRQMVFPAGLAVSYPNLPHGQPLEKVCLAVVLLVVISALVIACRKSHPALVVGWLWFLGMLVPAIGIVQISYYSHADRYTYLPEIGLALATTWAVTDWSAAWKHRQFILGALMTALVGALMVCAHIQTSYWKDSESLWTHALACTSGNYAAHYNLGTALAKLGKLDPAVIQFQKAIALRPRLTDAPYNLANALSRLGRLDEAIAQYRAVLVISPENVPALNNLGNALARQGADEAAMAQYQKVLQLQPDYADAHYELGRLLLDHGKLDDALAHFRQVVQLRPQDTQAQNALGQTLLLKGDLAGAMSCFEKTTTLSPDPFARWSNLGDLLLQQQDLSAAFVCYRQAAKINPRSADAWAALGLANFKQGNSREAIDSWQKALALNPADLVVNNNLAWLLATTPDSSLRDLAKAIALATKASQLSGGANPVILHTLAVAYAGQQNYALAMATARRALALAVGQKKDTLAATLQNEIRLYETNAASHDTNQHLQ
ncbi:MAG: tetratricopeptide repeat protein [Limisphaerales bacterium]